MEHQQNIKETFDGLEEATQEAIEEAQDVINDFGL